MLILLADCVSMLIAEYGVYTGYCSRFFTFLNLVTLLDTNVCLNIY